MESEDIYLDLLDHLELPSVAILVMQSLRTLWIREGVYSDERMKFSKRFIEMQRSKIKREES